MDRNELERVIRSNGLDPAEINDFIEHVHALRDEGVLERHGYNIKPAFSVRGHKKQPFALRSSLQASCS